MTSIDRKYLAVMMAQMGACKAEARMQTILLMNMFLMMQPPEGVKSIIDTETEVLDNELDRLQGIIDRVTETLKEDGEQA